MHHELRFRAMGSRARVVVNGDDPSARTARAAARIEELEARWSRFRPDSEISVLNRSGDRFTVVSQETFTLVSLAVNAWATTDGLFDPTLLAELQAQGYDRNHDELPAPASPVGAIPPAIAGGGRPPMRWSRCGDIVLDEALSGVLLPEGVTIDPGGIGKGLAADMVATELMADGARGVMVDLGGDIRIIGDHPDGGPTWPVIIDDPLQRDHELFRIGFADGGIATSSQLLRRWAGPHGDHHHLLDPTTGLPAASAVGSVVVATGATWWAEVLAKAALIAGFDTGARLIGSHRAAGVLFALDGEPHDVNLMAQATITR